MTRASGEARRPALPAVTDMGLMGVRRHDGTNAKENGQRPG
jgi:hypothetical protein